MVSQKYQNFKKIKDSYIIAANIMCSLIRVNHGYSLCVFFYSCLSNLHYISIEELRRYVSICASGSGCMYTVCMVGISFIYHITYIYTFNLKKMIRLDQNVYLIYLILPLGTLDGIGWLFWRYCCQTSPDVAVCGYWSNLR